MADGVEDDIRRRDEASGGLSEAAADRRTLLAILDAERMDHEETREALDAARSGPASGGGLDALLRRIERHVDCECGADHRYRFMEEVRVLSGSLAATEPTDEEGT
jgi:hypothetical protein